MYLNVDETTEERSHLRYDRAQHNYAVPEIIKPVRLSGESCRVQRRSLCVNEVVNSVSARHTFGSSLQQDTEHQKDLRAELMAI